MINEKILKLMTNSVSNTYLLARNYTKKGYILTENSNTIRNNKAKHKIIFR